MKQCLSLRRVALSLVLLVSIVGWALPSSAHRIKVFAYGEGGEVVAKSYFSSGKAVMHAPVAVYDDRNGDTLIKGKTDENGIFRFPVPVHAEQKRMDLKIIVNTGEGHRAEWLLTADEYLEKSGDNDTRGGISTIDQERPMQQVLHVAESTSSSCDEEMIATLVEQALLMALGRRYPTAGLLHHSDQGSQYTSALIQSLLADHHIQVSMSGVGNCYDNAPMESFFGRLKAECALSPFATRAETRLIIFEHIEVWYNRQRLHSSLGYLSPAAFEQRYYETNIVP